MWDDRGDGYSMMGGGGGLLLGLGLVVLVLLGIALVAVLANLYLHLVPRSPGRSDPSGPSEARRLLDRRLAQGELSVEEYTALRAALDG